MSDLYRLPDGLPKSLSLPWGDPPKPNVWKSTLVSQTSMLAYYEVKSPLLNIEKLLLVFVKRLRYADVMELVLMSKANERIYTLAIPAEDAEMEDIQYYLSRLWAHAKEGVKKYLKNPDKVASNLKTMEFPQEAPRRINIPWGDPAKPNTFIAVMQNQTAPKEKIVAYDVKSPLIDVDNDTVFLTFEKPLSDYPTLKMKLSYEKDGFFYNYERAISDCTLTEPQLLAYLRVFGKRTEKS